MFVFVLRNKGKKNVKQLYPIAAPKQKTKDSFTEVIVPKNKGKVT